MTREDEDELDRDFREIEEEARELVRAGTELMVFPVIVGAALFAFGVGFWGTMLSKPITRVS